MPALAGRRAQIKIPGAALSLTNEATSTTDSQTYTITNAAKRVLDRTATITVNVGGSPAIEAYTLSRAGGFVTFLSTDPGRAAVTITGSYLPMSVAAEAKSYTWELTGNNAPASAFGDEWVERVLTTRDVRGSLSRWWIDAFFSDALIAGNPLVFQFWSNAAATTADLTCWGLLSRRAMSLVHAGLNEEMLDFEGTVDAEGHAIDAIGTAAAGSLDELAYLRANISGGDSTLKAIYSPTYGGLTQAGGFASAVADIRGGGFGPSIAQATGSKQPAVSGTGINLKLAFDGSNDCMATATSAIFDLNGSYTMGLVVAVKDGVDSPNPYAIADSAGTARFLSAYHTGGPGATIKAQGLGVVADSTIAASTTRKLLVISKDGAGNLKIRVKGSVRVTTGGGANPAVGNNALTLGSYWLDAAPLADTDFYAAVMISRDATAGDDTALDTWATTYHGVA